MYNYIYIYIILYMYTPNVTPLTWYHRGSGTTQWQCSITIATLHVH